MQVIGSLWWLWLLLMVVSIGVVINDQRQRMSGVMNSFASGDPFKTVGTVQQGLGRTMIAGLIACGSGILLFLATIVNLVTYFKSS